MSHFNNSKQVIFHVHNTSGYLYYCSRQYSRLNQRHGKDPVYSFYANLSVLCYTQENGVLIESMDASFGLARKIAKGGNRISSGHRDLLFSDQDDVDNFVDNYPHCGNKSPDQVYLGPLSLE